MIQPSASHAKAAFYFFFSLLLLGISVYAFADETAGPSYAPQAVGNYGSGKLENADSFPRDGKGFIQLYRIRNHFYTTTWLSELIQWATGRISEIYPGKERAQVADIACPKGGKCVGHRTHQNGLDVDIIYLRNNMKETVDRNDPRQQMDEDFAYDEGSRRRRTRVVSPNFDIQRNLDFARVFVSSGRISRIYTDFALKGAMCRWAALSHREKEYQETLSKFVSIKNHQNHFHFRAVCPPGSPKCVGEKAPPTSADCRVFNNKRNAGGEAGGSPSLMHYFTSRAEIEGDLDTSLRTFHMEDPALQAVEQGAGLDEADLEVMNDEDE